AKGDMLPSISKYSLPPWKSVNCAATGKAASKKGIQARKTARTRENPRSARSMDAGVRPRQSDMVDIIQYADGGSIEKHHETQARDGLGQITHLRIFDFRKAVS